MWTSRTAPAWRCSTRCDEAATGGASDRPATTISAPLERRASGAVSFPDDRTGAGREIAGRGAGASGGANLREEALYLGLQLACPRGQALGPAGDLADGGGAAAGGLLDRMNLVGGARGAAGRGLHAAGDIAGGGALLLDRRRDGAGDCRQLLDGARDRGDLIDRMLGGFLDRGHLLGDVLGGARCLVGQNLDLGGDHRKALAGIAGARGLDGGVERQEVGLRRDRGDEADHRADALRRLLQRPDGLMGPPGVADRGARHLQPARRLLPDVLDGLGELLGRRTGGVHPLRSVARAVGSGGHAPDGVVRYLL